MKERIILAPGADNIELIKNLAVHGFNCFNLRICGAGELARMALMRSGITVSEGFISGREETIIVLEAVKGEKYFENATYSDLQEIAAAIRRMRGLVASGNESKQIEKIMSKGIFKEKNLALVSVYKKYLNILADKKLVDLVSVIRRAVNESEKIDADFIELKDYPLNPLENELLMKLSGGDVQRSSLEELYLIKDTTIKVDSFKNCYGAPNEVETIITEIYRSKNLDKCTVAVTDTGTYGQLFFDYALLYDIPITFGCGIPIINSNPAKLLKLYYHWMTGGFYGLVSIKALLESNAFDKAKLKSLYPKEDDEFRWKTFWDVLGGIRLTNDLKINTKRL
nr:hypothetical protein [Lachnospiraceae bacterium]